MRKREGKYIEAVYKAGAFGYVLKKFLCLCMSACVHIYVFSMYIFDILAFRNITFPCTGLIIIRKSKYADFPP